MWLFAKIFAGGPATEPLPAGGDRRAAARDGRTRRHGRRAREFGARLWERVSADEVSTRAAALAYYFIFALFPALLFFTALLGLLPVPGLMERLLGYVTQVLPRESAALVGRTLSQTLAGASTSLLSVGALGALWAAAAGMVALIDALNVAHGAVEVRSGSVRRSRSGGGSCGGRLWWGASWSPCCSSTTRRRRRAPPSTGWYLGPRVRWPPGC